MDVQRKVFNKLLTVKEASDNLEVHKKTVYKLIKSYSLPFYRTPGIGLRFKTSELESWLFKSLYSEYLPQLMLPIAAIGIEAYGMSENLIFTRFDFERINWKRLWNQGDK